MKAIVQERYGSADVLDFQDIAVPAVGEHQVLVRVVAAGVDRGAWHFMTGQPYLMRLLGFGFRAPKVRVPGTNVAGYVEMLAPDATSVSVGDEVYGATRGAYAEYVYVQEDQLAHKPPSLTFEQAAVLPYAGFAALQALREHGYVAPGQHVLIVGASGAVGSAAVQIAKAFGAHVTGVCSGATGAYVLELGADAVIDHGTADFGSRTKEYDLILDIAGRIAVGKLRRLLTRRGRLVIVGGEVGKWTGVRRQLWATLLSAFVPQRLGFFVVKQNAAFLGELNQLVDAGSLGVKVRRTYPLVEAADAMRALDDHGQVGRIAITV